jgi:16S rRNA processing protein RimM
MEQFLRIGVIASTHGIHGEVKVYPTTDSLERFKTLKDVVLVTQTKGTLSLKVESVKFFKQFAILKFEGLDQIEDIQKYKGCDLMVSRENAQPLEENEYYIGDLIGMKVESDEGAFLGTLKDVLQTGANDVYVVEREDKSELLLPVIDECILDVNLETGTVVAHMMEGLLDL